MADKLTLDRGAMKNRATSHLRIYVGNLVDSITIDDLYDHFQCYGQINGIVINKGFGFVQFETEASAQQAITLGSGSVLVGRNISVKTAQSNADKANRDKEMSSNHNAPLKATEEIEVPEGRDENLYDNYGNYIADQTQQSSDGAGEGYDESYGENFNQQQPALGPDGRDMLRMDRETRQRTRIRGKKRKSSSVKDLSPVGRGGSDWGDRGSHDWYRPPIEFQRPIPVSDRNDCEIIVVSKSLTEYAEYIEGRLKRLGIVVDLLFPLEDVTIGKVLGNIASRGSLYAILVMPQNQEHRSLTLTILHGLPQEHRNIPLEDALVLISRNYQEVQRGGSSGREAVYALLGQLADGRTLTVLQYDKIIEYLKEKREQQVKIEVGEPLGNKDKTHVDLQQRIMSILNDKNVVKADPAPVPPPVATANQTALLNDPTVRKALDSILLKLQ